VLFAIKGLKSVAAYFTGTYNVVVRFRRGVMNDDVQDAFMPALSTSSKSRAKRKLKELQKIHSFVEIVEYKSPEEDSE
jgi:hypothetical protein